MFNDEQTQKQREDICNTCPSKNGVRCGKCGCFLIVLRKIKRNKCPLGKWPK